MKRLLIRVICSLIVISMAGAFIGVIAHRSEYSSPTTVLCMYVFVSSLGVLAMFGIWSKSFI